MDRDEVKELFKLITSVYPRFEVSAQKVDTWTYLMKKMDFKRVMAKAEQHVMENKFPPTVAEIAAYPPEHNDHLDKMKQWEQEAAKVSEETKHRFKYEMQKLIREKRR